MNERTTQGVRVLIAVLALVAIPALATAQTIEGTWESRYRDRDDRWDEQRDVQLSLRIDTRGDGNWQSGFGISSDELRGLSSSQASGTASDVTFEMVREAGTIRFEGDIRNGRGAGLFTFTPSQAYLDEMATLGFSGISNERQLTFALQDVTTDYVRELQALGYTSLSTRELTQFAIHGVSAEFIRGMNELGYREIEPKQLVQLRIHGVTPDYVRQVRAALGDGTR